MSLTDKKAPIAALPPSPDVATASVSRYRPWLMDREARSELLHMMGLVAAIVAVVILVFFGLGYLFGRLFL